MAPATPLDEESITLHGTEPPLRRRTGGVTSHADSASGAAHLWQSRAISKAWQTSAMRSEASRPSRSMSTATETFSTESRFDCRPSRYRVVIRSEHDFRWPALGWSSYAAPVAVAAAATGAREVPLWVTEQHPGWRPARGLRRSTRRGTPRWHTSPRWGCECWPPRRPGSTSTPPCRWRRRSSKRGHDVLWTVPPDGVDHVQRVGISAAATGTAGLTQPAEVRRRYPELNSLPPAEAPVVMFGKRCSAPSPHRTDLPTLLASRSAGSGSRGDGTAAASTTTCSSNIYPPTLPAPAAAHAHRRQLLRSST